MAAIGASNAEIAESLGWQSHEPEAGHAGGDQSNPTLVNNAETLAQAAWI